MVIYGKCKLFVAAAALSALTLLMPVHPIRAAEPVPGKICESDECLMISKTGAVQNLYDSEGRFIFDMHIYYQLYYPCLAKTDTVFAGRTNEDIGFYSVKAGGRFMSVPIDDAQICLRGSFFTATSLSEGICVLYDCEGHELGRTVRPVWLSSERTRYRTHLLRLESGFVFGIQSDTDACWMWADPAAGICTEIQNSTLNDLLGGEKDCFPMGDLLVFYPKYRYASDGQEDNDGVVVSLDGEILLDHVNAIWQLNALYGESDRFSWDDELPCDFVLQMPSQDSSDEKMSCLFDKDLNLVGTFSDPDVKVEYTGKYVKGFVYPELNNSSCDGFAGNVGRETCPYYVVDGWYNVLIDGQPEVFPVRPEETLKAFNAGYYLTERVGESSKGTKSIYSVYSRHSNELFFQDDSSDIELYLGKDGLVIKTNSKNGEPYRYTAYDLNGTETFSSDSTWIMPLSGYWYTSRGIYRGITDIYGNWLVRTTYRTE